jgi:hypothetical protein
LESVPALKVVLLGDSGLCKTSIAQYFERRVYEAAIDSKALSVERAT